MIQATGIKKTFPARGGAITAQKAVHALRGVDIEIPDAGAVSLIGESGCGKTTLGRILVGLETLDAGQIVMDGTEVTALPPARRLAHQQKIQLIHQDPYASLNPASTIEAQMMAPLQLTARKKGYERGWASRRAAELLDLVGLDRQTLWKYPHQLSGGQRQRVVVARALTVEPAVLVADEAVSMIDVSLRLGILSLLRQLRQELGVAVLFITHDVAAARYVGREGQMYVIYRGSVVEKGPTDTVIQQPVHPYTQALLSALPVLRGLEQPGRDRFIPVESMLEGGSEGGCLFVDRCPFKQAQCENEVPGLTATGAPGDHQRHACFYPKVRQVVAQPAEA
jgi:oligopeptide/dipeptide ABC transporter ATP-binding protein